MKSTHFDLINPIYGGSEYGEVYERSWAKFEVPTLPAYSIINHTIDGTSVNVDAGTFALESEVVGSCVKIPGVDRFKSTFFPSVPVLTIYHFGVRDYSLLFPSIKNDELRIRVGCFMEEADKTFEQGAWLSFVVMACGVFEGVLADIVGDHKSTFGKILKAVEEKGFLDSMEFNALTLAKNLRNFAKFNPCWKI